MGLKYIEDLVINYILLCWVWQAWVHSVHLNRDVSNLFIILAQVSLKPKVAFVCECCLLAVGVTQSMEQAVVLSAATFADFEAEVAKQLHEGKDDEA